MRFGLNPSSWAPNVVLMASATWLLVACSAPKPVASASSSASLPAPVPLTVPGASAKRATLASEQVRLAELFRGTPVVFAMQQDGSLRATVPRRFSFDAGVVKIKPPLAAVLDRLAKSQLQTTTRMRVSAPADRPAGPAAIAQDRALSVRDHLIAQGIVAERVKTGTVVPAELVEIVVSESVH